MKSVVLALGGATAAWMAVPMVSMAVRGTLDQRTLASCRRTAAVPRPVVVIPAPRRAPAEERLPA
jgi:hypothetical protein